jgi:hypothetical protein
MRIELVHGRLVVGLWKEEWIKVFYEPQEPPEDITTPNLAPGILLYSHSRGDATDREPMPGQTAWDASFNPEYIASSTKAEKLLLQRILLWDAWRYLTVTEPAQIAAIKKQLQGSHRQTMLLKELDKARKARTNLIKQRTQRKAKRARLSDSNIPAKSIEISDDDDDDDDDDDEDSGFDDDDEDSGFDDDDDEDDEYDSEDRRRMPPPNHTAPRRPSGLHRTPFTALMSGARGDSIDEEGGANDLEIRGRTGSTALPSGRNSSSAAAKSVKRKQPFGQEQQRSSWARMEGSGGRSLFMTPPASGRRPQSERDVEDDDPPDTLIGQDANGGLDEEAAINEAMCRSEAPEGRDVWGENGGLDLDEAMRAAMRNSTAPEDDTSR